LDQGHEGPNKSGKTALVIIAKTIDITV
jgi:hypothetical protein